MAIGGTGTEAFSVTLPGVVLPGEYITATSTDSGDNTSEFSGSLAVGVALNLTPTADASAGAPYVIREGGSLTLDGSGSSDPESQPLSYEWDLDNDGLYAEAGEPTGVTPVVAWSTLQAFGLDDDGVYTIGLRVTDDQSQTSTTTATVTINNAPPTLSATGPSTIASGTVYSLSLVASDPGADTVTQWTVAWGDGTIQTYSSPFAATFDHVYANGGLYSISVSATDEDGQYVSGDLVVPGYATGDGVFQYDGNSGSFVKQFASSAGQLIAPYTMAMTTSGDYLVSGFTSDNVALFDAAGNYVREFIAAGAGGLDGPAGMAWGPDGNLYIASFFTNEILRFDPSGTPLGVWGTGGSGLNGPTGITFGPDGDLYVASWSNGKVVKYDGTTGGTPSTYVNSGLSGPEQLTFGPDGRLYIADGFNDRVMAFDGASLVTFAADSSLDYAAGLVFSPDGYLYVGSANDDTVVRFDGTTGVFDTTFIAAGSGGLLQPAHMAYSPDLLLQVATSSNNAPTATNLDQSIAYAEDDPTVPISDIVVTDADAGDLITVTLQVSVPMAGTLTAASGNGESYNATTGLWTINGTAAQVNTALADVAWQPTADDSTILSITSHVEDQGGAGPLDGTITLVGTPQNDAPVLDNSVALFLSDVLQDNASPVGDTIANILASGRSDPITDVDPGAVEGIAVIGVDDANGTWQYSRDGGSSWRSFVGDGVADGSIDNLAAILLNTADQIRYVPAIGYSGTAGLMQFRAWDQTSGSAGDVGQDVSVQGGTTAFSTAVESATLNVSPQIGISITGPTATTIAEDSSLVFSSANGNAVRVSDGSAADSIVQTRLAITNGVLTLSTTTGLNFASGADGTSTMVVVGRESAVNAALEGMTFTPTSDFSGSVAFQVDTNIEANLLAHYEFGTASNPGLDTGPTGAYDAAAVNGANVTTDGTLGNVLSFDGNDSVQVAGTFSDPTSVTLATWIQLDAGYTDDEAISLGDNVAIRVDDTGNGFGVSGFFFDGTFRRHTDSGTFIAGTGWHHVAYTVDSATSTQSIYIDGNLLGSTAYTGAIDYSLGGDTYLGRQGNIGAMFLHGDLDDVRIYDRALSGGEVAALFSQDTSDTHSVSIVVTPVNDAPTISAPANVLLGEGTVNVVTVTSSDIDGGTPTYSVAGGADAAAFSIDSATGLLRFKAAPNFEMPVDIDSDNVYEVTVRVADGLGGNDYQPVRVFVADRNDAPVGTSDSYTVSGGTTFTAPAPGVLANDFDEDGDPLAAVLVVTPTHGTLSLLPNGEFSYTPDANYSGKDSFSYRPVDGTVAGGRIDVAIKVTPTLTIAPTVLDPFVSGVGIGDPMPADPIVVDDGNDNSSTEEPAPEPPSPTNLPGPPPSGNGDGIISERNSPTWVSVPLSGPQFNLNLLSSLTSQQPAADANELLAYVDGTSRRPQFARTSLDRVPVTMPYEADFRIDALWNDLHLLQKELTDASTLPVFAAGSVAGMTSALTVGYVLWTIRSGWLVTSLLAQMPAWRLIDPLVVLDYLEESGSLGSGDDDDSLETMIARSQEDVRPPDVVASQAGMTGAIDRNGADLLQ